MEFSELIKKRQSDRKYADKPVEKEKIKICIESTRLSPSANNAQPWKFIVVDDKELVAKMAQYANDKGLNKFAKQAPVFVTIVLEKMNTLAKIGATIKDKEYSLMDVGIAANQFCLQAADLDLGTCIIGWFDEKKVKKLLHIPKNKRVPLLISLGYSEAKTRQKIRKATDKMSSWNKY